MGWPEHFKTMVWASFNIFPDAEEDARSRMLLYCHCLKIHKTCLSCQAGVQDHAVDEPAHLQEIAAEVFDDHHQPLSLLCEEEQD